VTGLTRYTDPVDRRRLQRDAVQAFESLGYAWVSDNGDRVEMACPGTGLSVRVYLGGISFTQEAESGPYVCELEPCPVAGSVKRLYEFGDGRRVLVNRMPSIYMSRNVLWDCGVCTPDTWGSREIDGKQYTTKVKFACESCELLLDYGRMPSGIDRQWLLDRKFLDANSQTNNMGEIRT